MQVKNGYLGESYFTKFGAVMVRVHHKSYASVRVESNKDILELLFLTQRSSWCIFQENCVDEADKRGWQGFSCRRCPFKNNPKFMAELKDMLGKLF